MLTERRRLEGIRSLRGRSWRWRLSDSAESVSLLSGLLSGGYFPLRAKLLAGRGVSVADAAGFLHPRLRDNLPLPWIFADMERAASRISSAIVEGESIALLSDSDADGSTSAALLYRYFRSLGVEVRVCTPNRFVEGYGPNDALIEELAGLGCSLLITLDCGTTSHGPLALAADKGIDVIVCDHHLAGEHLPRAHSVVNPGRIDDDSGQESLAGVGVAFMLALGVNLHLRDSGLREAALLPDLLRLTDLVALGTICDLRSLRGLNRAFVYHGLGCFRAGSNTGLSELLKLLGVDEEELSSGTLGYQVGPCINAGARLGESDLARRLLVEEDRALARDLAARLREHNLERRKLESRIFAAAVEEVEGQGLSGDVLVVHGEGWHRGVLGIVASRLREHFHLPSIVLSKSEGLLHGSGRSVAGVDLGSAILEASASGLLESGGGHTMAAGLSLRAERLEEFRAFLSAKFHGMGVEMESARVLELDESLHPLAVGEEIMRDVESLQPFGVDNSVPCFLLRGMVVEDSRVIGDSSGYGLTFRDSLGTRLRGVSFRSVGTDLGNVLSERGGVALDLAVHLQRDTYRGGISLLVEDASFAGG
ncbi:MAG: single-stranded-DNA-specific exonuclease RecJ [Alphaproteobacteria bacterium]